MLPFDLSQCPEAARDDLCMQLYRGLERMMATPDGRQCIERRTAEINRTKGGVTDDHS